MSGAGALLERLIGLWGDAMLRASWQGGAALLVAYLLQRLVPRLRPDVRCWIWRLAFAKLLLALFWAAPIPVPVLRAAHPAAVSRSAAISKAPDGAAHGVAAAPGNGDSSGTAPPSSVSPSASWSPARVRALLLPCLFGLWLCGALWCLIRLAGEWSAAEWLRGLAEPVRDAELMSRFWKLCKRFGVELEPRLLVTPGAGSPVLLGVRRPSVVLTSELIQDFTAEELDLMLAHEVGHLRRKDLPWGWLAALGQALFFFHPIVRIAGGEWKTAQEMACDELTVRVTGAAPGEYGQVLVKVAAQSRPSLHSRLATAGVLESAQALKIRLAAMKSIGRSSRGGAHVGLLVVTAGIVGLLPWKLVPRPEHGKASAKEVAQAPPAAPVTPTPAAPSNEPAVEVAPVPGVQSAPQVSPSVIGPPEIPVPTPPKEASIDVRINKGSIPISRFGIGVPTPGSGGPWVGSGNSPVTAPVNGPSSPATQPPVEPVGAQIDATLRDLDIGVPSKRMWALDHLSRLRPDRPREPVAALIEPYLGDRDLLTRAAAAHALALWARPESMPALLGHLEDPEHAVRWAVLETLGKLHDARAAAPLARRLTSSDRGFVSRALQELGPAAAEAVVPYLTDEEWTVRLEACRVLKVNGSPSQVPALRTVLQDANSIVAGAAEDALRTITSGK